MQGRGLQNANAASIERQSYLSWCYVVGWVGFGLCCWDEIGENGTTGRKGCETEKSFSKATVGGGQKMYIVEEDLRRQNGG